MNLNSIRSLAFSYIDAHQDEMLKLLKTLVSMESTSYDVDGVNTLIAHLRDLCEKDGLFVETVEFERAGSTLIAKSRGNNPELAPLAFIGHCDTVFQKGVLKDMPLALDEKNIYGPGALDMKGGLVIALYVIKALREAGFCDRAIHFIVSGDEETGHLHSESHGLMRDSVRGSAAAFVLETGYLDNKIIVQRKGVGRFTMECFGVAAHAGICPENGRHAILDMAHKIIEVQKLNGISNNGTTYNVGVIQGGTVANAVPDYCKVEIDIRYTDVNYVDTIRENLMKIAQTTYVDGVTCQLSGSFSFIPMEPTDANMALFSVVRQSAIELGYPEPYAGATGGGSDAAWPSSLGIPTVCAMGIQGGLSHTSKEFAQIDTLYQRSKLLISSILHAEEQALI